MEHNLNEHNTQHTIHSETVHRTTHNNKKKKCAIITTSSTELIEPKREQQRERRGRGLNLVITMMQNSSLIDELIFSFSFWTSVVCLDKEKCIDKVWRPLRRGLEWKCQFALIEQLVILDI